MNRRYPDTDKLTLKVQTLEDRALIDRRRIRALEKQVELLEAALIALASAMTSAQEHLKKIPQQRVRSREIKTD